MYCGRLDAGEWFTACRLGVVVDTPSVDTDPAAKAQPHGVFSVSDTAPRRGGRHKTQPQTAGAVSKVAEERTCAAALSCAGS